MAHITLSIPDNIHAIMKTHAEIKWSEIARRNVIKKAMELSNVISASDFYSTLSKTTQEKIESVSDNEWITYAKKVREADRKRKKF